MEPSAGPRQVPFFAGRYRCESYLGGGMADVYRAKDTELPRDVAIKILKPSNQHLEEIRAAFWDEVQLASRCSHENIVMTYDKGEIEGSPYIVMEFLRGENLDTIIKNGEQGGLKRIVQMALQIARGLEYVHSQNIVHRDLKPQNLHVDLNGRVKLVDFGIAKAADWNKTQVGMVKGTAYYMSPEQIMAEAVTFQTDIWSFGVVFYEMLCGGKRPFHGTNLDTIWSAIIHAIPDYAQLAEHGVSEPVKRVVMRCLEKKPESRYANFTAVAADLEAVLTAMMMTETYPAGRNDSAAKETELKKLSRWLAGGTLAVVLVLIGIVIRSWTADKPVRPQLPAKQLQMATGDMVLVEGGSAILGSDKHKVDLKAFYIDRTEVSNGAYAQFAAARKWQKPAGFAADKPDLPIVNVTFHDAIAFALWAGKRLPTSEEWEKAARGTSGQTFPWGNDFKPEYANLSDNPKLTKAQLMPVTSFAMGKSPYGALNMFGNVWEWVFTVEKPNPATLHNLEHELHKKLGPEEVYYMIRGGGIGVKLSPELMIDFSPFPASSGAPNIGFRCAMDAGERQQ